MKIKTKIKFKHVKLSFSDKEAKYLKALANTSDIRVRPDLAKISGDYFAANVINFMRDLYKTLDDKGIDYPETSN